ncbi:ABC transporter permease [Streptococcus rifensis]
MFGKLLKQEFKSVGKWYLGLYGLSIVFAIILGFWVSHMSQTADSDSFITIILTILTITSFGAIIAALGLSTLVLIIRRFKDNIYGRQGYLTMTLPATTHQILLSKLTAAIIWYFLSILAVGLSIFIIVLINTGWTDLLTGLKEIWVNADFQMIFKEIFAGNLTPYIISFLLGTVGNVLMLYCAIALGHLAESHRVLLSFVAFFVLYALLSIMVMLVLNRTGITEHYYWFNSAFNIVFCLITYFATHYMIKYKLNIQ